MAVTRLRYMSTTSKMEMLKVYGRSIVLTLLLCTAIVLSLPLTASSEEAVFNHWGAIEIPSIPNTTKWQVYDPTLARDTCDSAAEYGSSEFDTQWKTVQVTRRKVEYHHDITFHHLTIIRGEHILLYAWNVCLPEGETPNLESLRQRIPK